MARSNKEIELMMSGGGVLASINEKLLKRVGERGVSVEVLYRLSREEGDATIDRMVSLAIDDTPNLKGFTFVVDYGDSRHKFDRELLFRNAAQAGMLDGHFPINRNGKVEVTVKLDYCPGFSSDRYPTLGEILQKFELWTLPTLDLTIAQTFVSAYMSYLCKNERYFLMPCGVILGGSRDRQVACYDFSHRKRPPMSTHHVDSTSINLRWVSMDNHIETEILYVERIRSLET